MRVHIPVVVAALCSLIAALATRADAAPCRVQPGTSGTLIEAIVLTPERALPRGQVLVGADGRIACVGYDCAAHATGATVIACDDRVLSPGLINTHDHIDFAEDAPAPDRGIRYAHRHEWRIGLDGFAKRDFPPDRDPRSIAWGELRFLVGGTTSTVGGDAAPGLVRNLDVATALEGLPAPPVSYRVFPLDDAAGIMRTDDCAYGPHPARRADVLATHAFLAHVAEGRNLAARNEFLCESSPAYDWIVPQATLIHAVGLTPADLTVVAARGASLVWSPRSNLALYGRTLDIRDARRLGITIALGSDWLPTGSMNLNRELACAERYDTRELHGMLQPYDLWRMVTIDAARVTHDDPWIGSIAVGRFADLALFTQPHPDNPYRAVVDSSPLTTALVLRGGSVLYGDPALVDRVTPGCAALQVANAERRLCAQPGDLPLDAIAAYAAQHRVYPLAFDGTPLDEPPCDPVARVSEGRAPATHARPRASTATRTIPG